MAIEKVKVAARAAHPKVISTEDFSVKSTLPKGPRNGAEWSFACSGIGQ